MLRRLGSIAIGVAAAVVVLDVALRVALLFGAPPATEDLSTLQYSEDGRLGWELRPGVGDHNLDGFRGRQYSRVPAPGTIRIAAIGDSVTYGLGLPATEAFPTVLEQRLNAGGAGTFEVLNFGVPGYSTFQVRRQLDRVFAWNPAVVVLTFSTDDSETSPIIINVGGNPTLFRNEFEGHWWLDSAPHWSLVRWSPLYRLSSQAVVSLTTGARHHDGVFISAEAARTNVRAVADACRARGISFVLALSPMIPPYPTTAYTQEALAVVASLESDARPWSSLVVNLGPVYQQGRAAYQFAPIDFEHHSRAGAAAVGEFLATRMRAELPGVIR